MAVEIERKFLIKNDSWREGAIGVNYKQGYLARGKDGTVRVRIAGEKGILTVKGKSVGFSRKEFEYKIPVNDALEMLELCAKPLIEKTRYTISYKNLIWEVDEFRGENRGLIFAEVELLSEDQKIDLPDWIGKEVTGDIKYYNARLVDFPFSKWK